MIEFTKEQLNAVSAFLAQVRERAPIEDEEWKQAAHSRDRGRWNWDFYGFSGTDIPTAIWWYCNRYRPGSTEWRPIVILRALIKASDWDYVEPERMPVNDAALRSTPSDKKKARLAFIRKHGVAAFHQKVQPILTKRRCGGIPALFEAPATAETREYVAILAGIAGGKL